MIVKDEEEVIERCLESVKDIVDEIIIVDTGSKDNTKQIVSKFTDKIYDFDWVDDFSKARNFSFSKATKDYILWLDADDVFLEEDREKFKKLKEELDGCIDVYMFKYNYSFDENGNVTLVQNRERLLKRENNYKWISPIHEVIVPTGNIKDTDIYVTHKKEEIKDRYRNLKIFEKMRENGIALDDRQQYCYAKELYFLNQTEKAISEYRNFIDLYKNNYKQEEYLLYQAILELSDCYKRNGEIELELDTLMLVIKNQIPKPECLCRIGDIFIRKRYYKEAIYWFELALESKETETNIDYKGFIPYISLGVCYFWLNDKSKAEYYNELAGKIKPKDKTYLENKRIYEM